MMPRITIATIRTSDGAMSFWAKRASGVYQRVRSASRWRSEVAVRAARMMRCSVTSSPESSPTIAPRENTATRSHKPSSSDASELTTTTHDPSDAAWRSSR